MLRTATLCTVLSLLPPSAAHRGEAMVERYEPRTFLGYACADDCERHKAGFGWAERHDLREARRCRLLALPEAEGCLAYFDAGRDARVAGDRWAVENEIVRPRQCQGAGERFRDGCVQAVEVRAEPRQ